MQAAMRFVQMFLLVVVGVAFATPSTDRLKVEHQRVLDDLNAKADGGPPLELDDSRVPGILNKGWRLAGAWAAAYLDTHATPSTRSLERIFEGFAPAPDGVKSPYGNFLEYHSYSFTGRAVRIGPAIYVVEGNYGMDTSTGTFMVVARNPDGHFHALWNIKDLALRHYDQKDEIGRWAHLARRAYYNGPLDIREILTLSPATNGYARFLVDAYQAADGGTTLAQLSIWEWDGAEAKPLLVKVYQYAADYRGFRFDGRTLRISTKEDTRTFFSCGMCAEPRGVWTVRITPDGIQDLGHRFLEPELQWADELISKIEQREDTTLVANAQVVAALKDCMQVPSHEGGFSWGMLAGCRILRRGQQGAFVVVLDEYRLRFSYVLRNGAHYFTDVRIE